MILDKEVLFNKRMYEQVIPRETQLLQLYEKYE